MNKRHNIGDKIFDIIIITLCIAFVIAVIRGVILMCESAYIDGSLDTRIIVLSILITLAVCLLCGGVLWVMIYSNSDIK